MAEDRTFTLVGNFTDNITPKLNAVNSSLTRLTAQMERLRSVTQPLKKDFKELGDSSKLFSGNLNKQVADLRQANAALRDHARELGRVNRAYRAGARGQLPGSMQPPRGGGGGGSRGGGGANWGVAVGGSVLGNQLANIMTGAIVRGFQAGTNLMRIPFNYFVNSFAERIRDESSDIQSAGGLYAISQRKNLGMFADFQSAVRTQQAINYRLAESAAALPGSTAAYVQQGKRISDTIMTAMGANAPGMQKFAEELGAKQGNKLDALGLLIQKFTEKAVLLGQGTQYRGMYGVPQLVEMLMNAPNVSETMFQKFAVYRDMPILQSAFRDMQKDLAKTGAFTQERMRLVFELLDKALPNEVVQKHKNSMAGFLEAFNSAFLDPEVGLFGIGRKMKGIAPEVDQFGKILLGKAKADLSLYELIGQTLTGFGLPLSELVSILPQIYEPFAKIIPNLVKLRNVAQQFYYTFNRYTKDYEIIAGKLGLGTKLGREMKGTAGARGALTAIANLLVNFEALPTAKFTEIANKLKNPRFTDFLSVTKDLFSSLFNSDVMKQIGQTLGQMVGGALNELGSLMGGVTGTTSTGPFAEGLKAGWEQAHGTKGVTMIFRSLFGLILKVMQEAITKAPLETLTLASMMLAPSLLSGGLTGGLGAIMSGAGGLTVTGAGATTAGWLGALVPALTSLSKTLPPIAAAAAILVALGGGFENSFRQIIDVSAEFSRSLGGWFSGLGYIFEAVVAILGDWINAIGKLFGSTEAVTTKFDLLKGLLSLVVIPIQLVEAGLKGLAVALVQLRVWALSFVGSEKEKKEAAEMLSRISTDLNATRGQANVLYTTTLGTQEAIRQRREAEKELYFMGKEYARTPTGQARTTELKAFIELLNKQLKDRPDYDPKSKEARPYEATITRNLAAPLEAAARPQVVNLQNIRANSDRALTAQLNANYQLSQLNATMTGLVLARSSLPGYPGITVNQVPTGLPRGVPSVVPTPGAGLQGWNWQELTRKPPHQWSGGLGDAISQELKHKPPGSNLVIANSSETIIPAARGLGMKDFMGTLDTGFNRVAGTVQASIQNGYAGGGPMTNHITIVQQPGQDAEELAAIVAMKIGEAVAERRSASIFI